MCSGPVGDNQSYWGLIQVKISGNQLTAPQLENFKNALTAFLNSNQNGLPNNASAALANGTIKGDDPEDGTTIALVNRRP
jgi:hypothetical protein